MRASTSVAARRARAAFAGGGATRLHTILRQWMAPFDELERLVPARGRILDFGCGNGLFSLQLALASPQRTVHGVDLSTFKVTQGRDAARAAGVADRVSFDVIDRDWSPAPDDYDGAVIGDVLYLMKDAAIDRVVTSVAQSLRADGTLVVKEVATSPAWKHRVALAQEFASVRLLHLTKGDTLNHAPLNAVAAAAAVSGWSVGEVPLHAGYPYSHTAVTMTRPHSTRPSTPTWNTDARR